MNDNEFLKLTAIQAMQGLLSYLGCDPDKADHLRVRGSVAQNKDAIAYASWEYAEAMLREKHRRMDGMSG